MKKTLFRGALLIAANVVVLCMLSFYRTTDAAPPTNPRQPFANPVAQRDQMIRELQEITSLLKEQNALLRMQSKNEHHESSDQR